MKFSVFLFLCFSLFGCASPLPQPRDGVLIDTPIWGIEFCQAHPAKPECD